MTVIKIIAFIIFGIACVTIYHNTNSYEPKKRILYIAVRNGYNVCNNKYNMCNRYNGDRGKK